MTKEEISIIIECCRHFNFWYTQHTTKKETTLLGRKYKDLSVLFDESPEGEMFVKIYNGFWEGNPKCISIQMPIETRENLFASFKVLGLNEVVTYLKQQFKPQ